MYGLSASNLAASTQATNYANYQSGQDAGDLLSAFGSAYGSGLFGGGGTGS